MNKARLVADADLPREGGAQRPIVEVAVGVLLRPNGDFLLTSRPPGKVYAGYWEFPGGKIEAGESPRQALVRELHEELGIMVDVAHPWIVREFVYEHAHVRLHFFRVSSWSGELRDLQHDALAWQEAGAPAVAPMLPANAPTTFGAVSSAMLPTDLTVSLLAVMIFATLV